MDERQFATQYLKDLQRIFDTLDVDEIQKMIRLLREVSEKGHRVYMIGNGGSSAIVSHLENDLRVGLKKKGLKPILVTCLSDNTPVVTALANDIGYEHIFSFQLKDVMKPHDVLLAVSSSGNSPNIINAVDYAKGIGAKVIGFSGFDGGRLKELSDIRIHVPTLKGSYGPVEDTHGVICHLLFTYFMSQPVETAKRTPNPAAAN